MKKALGSLFVIGALLLVGCGSPDSKGTKEAPKTEKQKLIAQIESLEAELLSGNVQATLDQHKAEQIVIYYVGFADNNPQDEKSAEYLFKAGEVSIGLGNFERSVRLFDRVIKNHPEYDQLVEAHYMKGFVYENHLDQRGMAIDVYNQLISNYPTSKFADDAKAAVENLSLSDEELIEKFKAKQAKAASQALP